MALCQNELLAVERGASFNGEALHQCARLFSSFHEPEITTFIWDTRIKGNQTPPGFHSTELAKSQHNSIHAFRQILGTGTATSPAEKKTRRSGNLPRPRQDLLPAPKPWIGRATANTGGRPWQNVKHPGHF